MKLLGNFLTNKSFGSKHLSVALVAFLPLWYNGQRYHPYTGTERGCATMSELLISFLLSVLASVVAYYICKWLDGDK